MFASFIRGAIKKPMIVATANTSSLRRMPSVESKPMRPTSAHPGYRCLGFSLSLIACLLLIHGHVDGATPTLDTINPTQTTAAAGLNVTVTVNGSGFENGA